MFFYKRIIHIFVIFTMCFSSVLLFSACGHNNTVILCEYKDLTIPPEIYEVSSEDLTFAIEMSLLEKEILEVKGYNANIVEEGDVLDLTLSSKKLEKRRIKITQGETFISENFDTEILGLQTNRQYSLMVEDDIYNLYIHKIYQYSTSVTDEIANEYYNKKSGAEVVDDIRTNIEEHRKFEYAYEYLISRSQIKTNYTEKEEYSNRILNNLKKEAQELNLSTEEYVEDSYGVSLQEYCESLLAFYDEFSVLKAFAVSENIEITDQEYQKFLEDLSESYEMTEEELLCFYGIEYIEYYIYYDKSYNVLLGYLK